jgi:hypothetical protein
MEQQDKEEKNNEILFQFTKQSNQS